MVAAIRLAGVNPLLDFDVGKLGIVFDQTGEIALPVGTDEKGDASCVFNCLDPEPILGFDPVEGVAGFEVFGH